MERRQNTQTIAWFDDLRKRELLDLDPVYQRRSVWNQSFKEFFVETILLNYPAPAVFLFEEVSPEGRAVQHVVDGKQRLVTVFEFLDGRFPVADDSIMQQVRGLYFNQLSNDVKKRFFSYQFSIEYVPEDDNELIKNIFDRINRNVAKLTPQELRHARFDGVFISACERLSDWMASVLPEDFPRIATQSKKHMKDVELTSLLLLLIEKGVQSQSQRTLDEEFALRDGDWEAEMSTEKEFRETIDALAAVVGKKGSANSLIAQTRFRNQAEFYSLFGATLELQRKGLQPSPEDAAARLSAFATRSGNEELADKIPEVSAFNEAARAASSDKGSRETRIRILSDVLTGALKV